MGFFGRASRVLHGAVIICILARAVFHNHVHDQHVFAVDENLWPSGYVVTDCDLTDVRGSQKVRRPFQVPMCQDHPEKKGDEDTDPQGFPKQLVILK